jgi:hypothetical protein
MPRFTTPCITGARGRDRGFTAPSSGTHATT